LSGFSDESGIPMVTWRKIRRNAARAEIGVWRRFPRRGPRVALLAGAFVLIVPVCSASAGPASVGPAAFASQSMADGSWSGFINDRSGYTGVYGTITVPDIRPGCGQNSRVAIWAGIGGDHWGGFMQAGITVTGSSSGAWWEVIGPNGGGDVQNVDFAMQAGDQVRVRTTYDPDTATITFAWNNLTTSLFRTKVLDHAARFYGPNDAEWVIEWPGNATAVAHFTPIVFSHLGSHRNGAPADPLPADIRVTMAGSAGAIAVPTKTGDQEFTTRWFACN
jgi:hypothetical protein